MMEGEKPIRSYELLRNQLWSDRRFPAPFPALGHHPDRQRRRKCHASGWVQLHRVSGKHSTASEHAISPPDWASAMATLTWQLLTQTVFPTSWTPMTRCMIIISTSVRAGLLNSSQSSVSSGSVPGILFPVSLRLCVSAALRETEYSLAEVFIFKQRQRI